MFTLFPSCTLRYLLFSFPYLELLEVLTVLSKTGLFIGLNQNCKFHVHIIYRLLLTLDCNNNNNNNKGIVSDSL